MIVDLTRAPQAFRYVGPDEFERPVQTTVARRAADARRPVLRSCYGPGSVLALCVSRLRATTPFGYGYPYG